MSSHKLPRPELIEHQSALAKLAKKLANEPIIAVDTEANSLYAYHERVCLIQFSVPDQDYLVDPIVLGDVSPLAPIFKNPNIEKIFHAAEYDLIILGRDFGFSFAAIFDTMMAARILGWKSVGLSSILKAQFGVVVNKKYQRANWGRRPLPPEMLVYAQLDTHYLIQLRNQLKPLLQSKGRWKLAQEDFERIAQLDPSDYSNHTGDCWRINGSRKLKPKQLAVLHALCEFRNQKAKALDRPLFKVITDQALYNIAVACPETLDELERVPNFSHRQTRWIGNEVLDAIRIGKQSKPPQPPRHKRQSEQFIARKDRLREWRKKKARSIGVESDVVLPKDVLYQLAEKNPRTQAAFREMMKAIPWRLDHFGDEIFRLLKTPGK